MSKKFEIITINSPKDFVALYLHCSPTRFTEEEYKRIEFYSHPCGLSGGLHREDLRLMGGIYGAFLEKAELGHKFYIETDETIFLYEFTTPFIRRKNK